MKISRVLASLGLTMALLLSGCTQEESQTTDGELSSVDEMFLSMMIPHHDQAVEMSHLAKENTSNPEILELAKAIDEEQHKEIDLMSSWLGGTEGHDHGHEGHMMDGMLSEEQMAELKNAKDAEFDRLFLEGMILHHEGAIEMVQMVVDTENQQVKELANSIIKSQTAQIEQMRNLLASLN